MITIELVTFHRKKYVFLILNSSFEFMKKIRDCPEMTSQSEGADNFKDIVTTASKRSGTNLRYKYQITFYNHSLIT